MIEIWLLTAAKPLSTSKLILWNKIYVELVEMVILVTGYTEK